MECPIDSHMNQQHNHVTFNLRIRLGRFMALATLPCCSGELAAANNDGFLFPHVCYALIWMIDALDLYSVDGSRVIRLCCEMPIINTFAHIGSTERPIKIQRAEIVDVNFIEPVVEVGRAL